MIAVAVVGLLLAGAISGVRLKRRHDYFESRARNHTLMESDYGKWERKYSEAIRSIEELRTKEDKASASASAFTFPSMAELREDRETYGRHAAYHAAMARKYRRATRYPWLFIDPDPPEPGWRRFFGPFGYPKSGQTGRNGEGRDGNGPKRSKEIVIKKKSLSDHYR